MTELKVSNGLYGNVLVDISNPVMIAGIIENDCVYFTELMSGRTRSEYLIEIGRAVKSFKLKIKNFFKRIWELLKKIKNGILFLVNKIREKIFKKRKEAEKPEVENESAIYEEADQDAKTVKISNYVSLAIYALDIPLNPMGVLDVIDDFDVSDKDPKFILDGVKTGKIKKELVAGEIDSMEENMINTLKNAGRTFDALKVSKWSKGAIKADIDGDSLSEVQTAINNKFKDLHKYASENKVELEVINTNGHKDFKNPINEKGYTFNKAGLDSKSTRRIYSDYSKYIDEVYKEITTFFKSMDKFTNTWFEIAESTINDASSSGEINEDMSAVAKYAFNELFALFGRVISTVSGVFSSLLTNLLRIVNGAVIDIDVMTFALK